MLQLSYLLYQSGNESMLCYERRFDHGQLTADLLQLTMHAEENTGNLWIEVCIAIESDRRGGAA